MRGYYKCCEVFNKILREDMDVNTRIHGRTEDRDLYKKNIYPMVHIVPRQNIFPMNNNTLRYSFEIAAMDVRDISKSLEEDKFEGNDNQIDNLNTCSTILNRLISRLRKQDNDGIYILDGDITADVFLFRDHNLLDGWVINITLVVPNDELDICS